MPYLTKYLYPQSGTTKNIYINMNRISVKQPYELLASYAIYTQTSSKPMSIEPFGSLYPETPNQKSQTESRSETKAMHHILEWFRSFPQLFRMLATCGSLALLRTVDFAKSRTIGFILGDSVVVKAAKTHTHTPTHTHTHTFSETNRPADAQLHGDSRWRRHGPRLHTTTTSCYVLHL